MKRFCLLLFCVAAFAQEPEEQGSNNAGVLSLSITNAATSASHTFQNGMVLDGGETYFVTANCNSKTASVIFKLDQDPATWDYDAPFQSVPGSPLAGKHTMQITPANQGGKTANTVSVTFSVAAASATPTPSLSPSPTLSPTATPSNTPASPSPSPSPTPASVTVQVINPTAGDTYDIYYGQQPNNYGSPVPIPPGQSSVRIGGLGSGTYYFADIVTRGSAQSPMSSPVAYTITTSSVRVVPTFFVLLAVIAIVVFIVIQSQKKQP